MTEVKSLESRVAGLGLESGSRESARWKVRVRRMPGKAPLDFETLDFPTRPLTLDPGL